MRWAVAQIAIAAAAALAVGPGPARRSIAAFLVAVAVSLPFFAPPAPLPRALLAFVGLLALLKTIEIGARPGHWPAWRRLWHVCMPFDVRRTQSVRPAVDPKLLGRVVLLGGIGGFVFFLLLRLRGLGGQGRDVARLLCGAVLVYVWVEATSEAARFAHRVGGIEVPPIQRAPILARSVGEFWSERWNRPWSDWLRRFVFLPLARRRLPALGLFAAFVVSGVMHAWMFAAALGMSAAVMTAGFFLIQGTCALAETRFNVRTRPSWATRAWTLAALLVPSPLFVHPFLCAFGL